MNKCYTLLLVVLISAVPLFGQMDFPEFQLEQVEVEGHLRFLASDALEGRMTGSRGNNLAAEYIANYFEAYGLKTLPGEDDYFQPVLFTAIQPPQKATLEINKVTYTQGDNLLIKSGHAINVKKTKAVFANFGWVDPESGHDDYKDLDVNGKIVITLPGTPEGSDNLTIFRSESKKRKLAAERGAIAILELYRLPSFPWQFYKSYFGKENLTLKSEEPEPQLDIPHGWIKEGSKEEMARIQNGKKLKASISSSGYFVKEVISNNVAGMIEGTDPQLKEEFMLLTAHYDHVGMGKSGGGAITAQDSIFNGARDNGIGTVALLSAAKTLSQSPPKRSVICLAVTGEEIGLLGSSYYAEHPIIPLKQTKFNLNTDGAGYNDTQLISILGFGRTGTDELITSGVESVGLKVFPDPAPEQNLFDRSDNVSFARKGVPALTFSPGFTAFDKEISKYYHQVSDEVQTIEFNYLLKFCQSFTYTARLISDMDKAPFWAKGDKYEKAGKALYGHH